MIGLPNPDQRSVAKTSGFPHPYIYTYTARALPLERILALKGEGITWMGQPSRQGIALFSVRTEFWRSARAVTIAYPPKLNLAQVKLSSSELVTTGVPTTIFLLSVLSPMRTTYLLLERS